MAFFEYLNGFKKVLYWSKQKMLTHADRYSPAFSKDAYDKIQRGEISDRDLWKYSSFWYKDFDGMAKKTMLRHFLKYCDSKKCIRGAAHARKANWHEGFCLECAFNPYNMAAQREEEEMK